jgi:hypothetical protein
MADRQLKDARRAERDLKGQWRRHKQGCRTCAQLRHDRYRWCDEGYDISREILRAGQLIERLGRAASGEQMLPGMEQLRA